jgi:glutathione S-transferase
MSAKLYSLALSHPSQAVRLMLELKGIDHEVKDLLPGFHPPQLRLAGFRGDTVPALEIDGRRLQSSLAISRALDEIQPDPPLFPREPERRHAVEEAEAWGEREFQPVPRRIFRWSVTHSAELRRWMAKSIGMPAPGLTAAMNVPIARHFARKAGAGDERVRADVKNLPSIFDHVDALIAEGTLGGTDLNAADFQIGATARVFLGFEDLAPLLDGRPTKELALRVLPRYQGRVPRVLPAEWLAGAGLAGSRTAA